MGQVLRFMGIPGVPRLLAAATFGRLAYSMVGLAVFFQVEQVTGSVAVAGLAAGLSAGVGAVTAGPRGMLVDRFGQTRPLLAFVPVYAISCVLLALAAQDGRPSMTRNLRQDFGSVKPLRQKACQWRSVPCGPSG